MDEIVSIVSQIGFPIGVAIIAFYTYYQLVNNQLDASQHREDSLMEQSRLREEKFAVQLDKFSDVLNTFSTTMTKIDDRLAHIEKELDKD